MCLVIYYIIQRGSNDVYSSVNVTDRSLTPLNLFPVKTHHSAGLKRV